LLLFDFYLLQAAVVAFLKAQFNTSLIILILSLVIISKNPDIPNPPPITMTNTHNGILDHPLSIIADYIWSPNSYVFQHKRWRMKNITILIGLIIPNLGGLGLPKKTHTCSRPPNQPQTIDIESPSSLGYLDSPF